MMLNAELSDNFIGQQWREKRAAKKEIKAKEGKGWRKTWNKEKANIKLNIGKKVGAERQANRREIMKGVGNFAQNALGKLLNKTEELPITPGAEIDDEMQLDARGRYAAPPEKSNTGMYIGIGAGVLVVGLILFFVLRK